MLKNLAAPLFTLVLIGLLAALVRLDEQSEARYPILAPASAAMVEKTRCLHRELEDWPHDSEIKRCRACRKLFSPGPEEIIIDGVKVLER